MKIQKVSAAYSLLQKKFTTFSHSERVPLSYVSCDVFYVRSVCGGLFLVLAILLSVLDPIDWITKYMLRVYEGSDVYMMFKNPDYVFHHTVHIFNYTNTERYLSGLDHKLKVEEVGPFVFREVRHSLNLTVDTEQKVLRMASNSSMVFVPELSVARTEDVRVIIPNLVMIGLGTMAADALPSWSNGPVALLMRTVGAKLFINVTIEEFLWGYNDTLVDLAATYFPGWIDFKTVGMMKMFCNVKPKEYNLETEGENMFAIRNMNGSPGLKEQGYEGPETANYCNTIQGTYQCILRPNYPREQTLSLFKYDGCRAYQFVFQKEGLTDTGIPYNRFVPHVSLFNASGPYACRCDSVCPPNGLIDISSCYYGFPVYMSAIHFYSGDPELLEPFEGLSQDEERARIHLDYDTTSGVPLDISMAVQTSVRVHVSPYNSEMKPLSHVKFLPVIYNRLTTPYGPSAMVTRKLRLLHVHFPRILVSAQLLLGVLGVALLGLNLLMLTRSKTFERKKEERRTEAEDSMEPLHLKIKQ